MLGRGLFVPFLRRLRFHGWSIRGIPKCDDCAGSDEAAGVLIEDGAGEVDPSLFGLISDAA